MSRGKDINLKAYIKPLKMFFELNDNKQVSESEIALYLKLKPNQMRWVLAELRYKMPILHLADRTYLYTSDNVELLQKEYDKLEAVVKQKSIKKNIIKRQIKKIKGET